MKKLSLLVAVLSLFLAFSVLAESVNKKELSVPAELINEGASLLTESISQEISVPPVNEETLEKTSVPVEPINPEVLAPLSQLKKKL